MPILLASASPRRRALLAALGYQVRVQPSDIDETPAEGESPQQLAQRLARLKASASAEAELAVVAADTVVALGTEVFGKPRDEADARQILGRLSGRTHTVWTGWAVRRRADLRTGVVATEVSFRPLTGEEIAAYVASGEPADKAGAYGIQGLGGALVDRLVGSYPSVVGLPVREVVDALRALGAGPEHEAASGVGDLP